jgi:4-amino-4-deoxy-L-arabinose transferase-like glycosyltransferase
VLHGPLPPDELRYLSVAWEMWSRGDLVLPYLNGAPYNDKGPLLFWLMHAGWTILGVVDWWPRLLPGLLTLTAVLLARALCRVLWPGQRSAVALVPWILLGSFAVSIYSQVVMFDLLLTNCTLLALLGTALAERGSTKGWALLAAGTALGLLSKGPAAFLHFAPAALLVPWWRRGSRLSTAGWYLRLAAALGVGTAVALGWAAAAMARGGASYGIEILLHQTTGRVVSSFAHARPFWFYLAILPALFSPWSAWPTAWAAVRGALRAGFPDDGWRFLTAALVPAVVAFSAMSGKQPHYLLPAVPVCACLVAAAVDRRKVERDSAYLPGVLAAAAAVAMALLPVVAPPGRLTVEPWSPVVGVSSAVAMLMLGRRGTPIAVPRRVALLAPLLVISAQVPFFLANRFAYDTATAAGLIRSLQDAGHPIAYARDYEGEFHFSGRLNRPLEIVGASDVDAAVWLRSHPDGYLVRYGDLPRAGALYNQRLRGDWLSIERARP